MRKHNKTRLALAVAGALAGMSSAHALEFTAGTWKLNIDGSVNAFYTNLDCDKSGITAPVIAATLPACGVSGNGGSEDSANIQNGLLPGYIKFSASTQAKGLDLKAVVGLWPGTSSGNGINNTGTTPDVRTVFVEFGSKNWGSFKLGRDIGLFQQQAILNDMTLLSVGTGAGFQGAINTTLGMIGTGYIYTEFQPQITYTTPKFGVGTGGFSASLGAFQPRNTAGVGGVNDITDSVGWQALAQFDWGGGFPGKLWGSWATQEAEVSTFTATGLLPGTQLDGDGYEVGGKISFPPALGLELMVVGFWGEGLGEAIQFANGHDATGQQRDSDGFLAQATIKPIPELQLGVSYGESHLDGTPVDLGLLGGGAAPNLVKDTESWVFQVKYDLMPGLSLIGEYISSEQNAQSALCASFGGAAVACENQADTFAIGAIVFF